MSRLKIAHFRVCFANGPVVVPPTGWRKLAAEVSRRFASGKNAGGKVAKRCAEPAPEVSKSDGSGFVYPHDIEAITSVPLVCDETARTAEAIKSDAKYRFPSVTKILDVTRPEDSRIMLLSWQKKMSEKLGKENFGKMVSDRLKLGHGLHEALLMQYLTLRTPVDEIELTDGLQPYWNSLKPLLANFGSLVAKECWVSHGQLCYKGQMDAMVNYKDRLVILELKTSDKLKATLDSTYDAPLQLAAYAGAVNSTAGMPTVSSAVIVVCYKDAQASVFDLNTRYLQYYWQKWLERVKAYWTSTVRGAK